MDSSPGKIRFERNVNQAGSPVSKKTGNTVSGVIAKVVKYLGVGGETFTLIGLFLSTVLVITIMWFSVVFLKLPWYFSALFIIFIALLVLLQVITVKRVATVDISTSNIIGKRKVIKLDPDEEVTGYIGGIAKRFGKGYEFLGVGKILTSENCLIATTKRVLFATAPVPGAGKIISGLDISQLQWLLAKKDVENKAREMADELIKKRSLVLNYTFFFLYLDAIKEIKTNEFFGSIKFITKDNKSYTYITRDKKDLEKVRKLFSSVVKII